MRITTTSPFTALGQLYGTANLSAMIDLIGLHTGVVPGSALHLSCFLARIPCEAKEAKNSLEATARG